MNFNPLIEIKLKLVKGTTSYLLLKEKKMLLDEILELV